jgi:hypothetical protein
MNPDDFSKELQLQPKYQWKAGDKRRTPKGKSLPGTYDLSYWCYNINSSSGIPLGTCLKKFVDDIAAHKDFLKRISDTGGRLEFFVGLFSQEKALGEILGWQLLQAMAGLNIDLALDIYLD